MRANAQKLKDIAHVLNPSVNVYGLNHATVCELHGIGKLQRLDMKVHLFNILSNFILHLLNTIKSRVHRDLKNCFINFKRFHIGTLHSFSISFAMNSMHDELETL